MAETVASTRPASGYIYAITCTLFSPLRGIKLGKTLTGDTQEVAERALLNRYSTPLGDPRVVAIYPVADANEAERALFRRLTGFRIFPRRELFQADLSSIIIPVMQSIANINVGDSQINGDKESVMRVSEICEFLEDERKHEKKKVMDSQLDTFPVTIALPQRELIFEKTLVDKRADKIHTRLVCEFAEGDFNSAYCQNNPTSAKACVHHVKRICQLLGIQHTLDNTRHVTRKDIQDNLEELNSECMHVIKIMKFRDQVKSSYGQLSFDSVKSRVDNVLGNWAGTSLLDEKSKNKHAIKSMRIAPSKSANAVIARILMEVEPIADAVNCDVAQHTGHGGVFTEAHVDLRTSMRG